MARTTFSGPVRSNNGFESGTSADPISVTTATNITSSYATSSATTGDTRLSYSRLDITSTGSGETLRAFTRVTGANAATGGTVNGAHISLSVNSGGTISGAGNALRVTLGAAAGVSPGGTTAVIQADSDFNATATVPTNCSFIRVTNTNTGVIGNLFNLPDAMVEADVDTAGTTHKVKFIDASGNVYYLMATTVAP
jgi:hypothetical protein